MGRNSSVLCHPFDRRCCRPSALDTSTTALTALESASCSIVGLSQAIFRSFGPLSCTYVISFPGPHSEPPVSSFCLVHRGRHTRPARAPVYAPAPLPSHAASPITHTPARSESAAIIGPPVRAPWRVLPLCSALSRVLSSADCDDRLGCVGILTAAPGTLLVTMLVCFGMPNTDWRQCDVRASAKGVRWHAALVRAHTAALLCHLGPLLHFKKSASGLPTAAGGRATGSRPQ